jgi:hypothetical protein
VNDVNRLIGVLKVLKGKGETPGSQTCGLLVPEDNDADKKSPAITVTGAAGDLSQTIEDDDPKDFMSPETARKKAGLGPDDGRVDGWRGRPDCCLSLVVDHQMHRAIRWSESQALLLQPIWSKKFDITRNRCGEMQNDNKEFLYGRFNDPIIQGVAWLVKDGFQNQVDMLIPVPKGTKGGIRVELAVKVKWTINGKKVKSWETRTTIRRLWVKGDDYIYQAAQEQESRYGEWKAKQRPTLGRSPTPGVVPPMEETNNVLKPGEAARSNSGASGQEPVPGAT